MKKRVHYAELKDMHKYIEGFNPPMITRVVANALTLLSLRMQETTTTSIYLWM